MRITVMGITETSRQKNYKASTFMFLTGGEKITTIKTKNIINEAVEVKTFIERNKKLPRYCTIQGNQYSVYTTAYLISRTISNLKADTFNVKAIGIILEIIGLFMVIIGLLISKEIIYISVIPFLLSIFINLYMKGGCT